MSAASETERYLVVASARDVGPCIEVGCEWPPGERVVIVDHLERAVHTDTGRCHALPDVWHRGEGRDGGAWDLVVHDASGAEVERHPIVPQPGPPEEGAP